MAVHFPKTLINTTESLSLFSLCDLEHLSKVLMTKVLFFKNSNNVSVDRYVTSPQCWWWSWGDHVVSICNVIISVVVYTRWIFCI